MGGLLRPLTAALVAAVLFGRGAVAAASTLRPALSGERPALTLPGFGQVAYSADPRGTGRPLILTHSVNVVASARRS